MQPDHEPSTPVRDTTLGILVSLYLILLGFFAVLNSISYDRVDKAGAVLDSINESFKAPERAGPEIVDLLAGGGEAGAARILVEQLRGVFKNAVIFEGRFAVNGSSSLKILLPREDVFAAGNEITDNAKRQFETLGTLLAGLDSGRNAELEIGLGIGQYFPSSETSARRPSELSRVDSLARLLAGIDGLGTKFGVGYAVLAPEYVQIHFKVFEGPRSAVTFSARPGG